MTADCSILLESRQASETQDETMSLGSQCWGCRWRRVRCDSQQPDCSKCVRKGLQCPGYSATKPLRWRHRVAEPGTVVQLPSFFNPTALAVDDIAPSRVILDALTYCAFVDTNFAAFLSLTSKQTMLLLHLTLQPTAHRRFTPSISRNGRNLTFQKNISRYALLHFTEWYESMET